MSSASTPIQRKNPNHRLYWAIPLLTGLAAYLWTAAGPIPAATLPAAETATTRSRATEKTRPTDVAALCTALQQQQQPASSPSSPEANALASLSGEQLRTSFLDLTQRLQAAKDWGTGNDLQEQATRISAELGRREGEAGVTWVESHIGEELYDCQERMSGMDSWARQIRFAAIDAFAASDPSGALAHVTASTRHAPCSEDTVFRLLQGQAAAGDDALRDAATRIPWELFDPAGQSFSMPGALPQDADMQPWLRSGAASALAGQGIYIRGFLPNLALSDPAQAIAAWRSWPHPSDELRNIAIGDVFSRSAANPVTARRMDEFLAGMDEATAAAVLPTIQQSITRFPALAPIYRQRFPHAFPADGK